MSRKSTLMIFAFLMHLPSLALSTTYYVSSSGGNDSNSGTSEISPWKSLSRVNSMNFGPGDVIKFRRGDIWSESASIKITVSGTKNSWITFADYGNGNRPYFNFSSNTGVGIQIEGEYIKIQNLHVYNSYKSGLQVHSSSYPGRTSGIAIIGCYFQDAGRRRASYDFGLNIGKVDGVTILDTTLDHNYTSGAEIYMCTDVVIGRTWAINHTGGNDHDGFLIQNSSDVRIYDSGGYGNSESALDLGTWEGNYVGHMTNVWIYNFTAYGNNVPAVAGGGVTMSGSVDPAYPYETSNIYFFNLLSYNNTPANAYIYDKVHDVNIVNSTLDNSGTHNVKVDNGARDVHFLNCLITNSGGDPVNSWSGTYTVTNLSFDYTFWYPTLPATQYRGAHYWNVDPKYTDRGVGNYTLKADSLAIDVGGHLTVVAPGDDCKGSASCDTTVLVDNARFFQDASWSVGRDPFATIVPDWICIHQTNNCAQIASVNYSTNILTLLSPLSRNSGDSVWLYKNLKGNVALNPPLPDIGSFEATPIAPVVKTPQAPSSIVIP